MTGGDFGGKCFQTLINASCGLPQRGEIFVADQVKTALKAPLGAVITRP